MPARTFQEPSANPQAGESPRGVLEGSAGSDSELMLSLRRGAMTQPMPIQNSQRTNPQDSSTARDRLIAQGLPVVDDVSEHGEISSSQGHSLDTHARRKLSNQDTLSSGFGSPQQGSYAMVPQPVGEVSFDAEPGSPEAPTPIASKMQQPRGRTGRRRAMSMSFARQPRLGQDGVMHQRSAQIVGSRRHQFVHG